LASGARRADLIADGVYRCGTELVNWYLVDDGGRLTVVDCGAKGYWPQLDTALEELGRTRSDIAAVVLTHGHVDHVGFAERLRSEAGVPVYVHENDEQMVLTGKIQKTEGSLVKYLRYPFAYRMITHLAMNGPSIPKVAEVTTYADGARLDVPGNPLVIHTPGHSRGHCALEFSNVVFVGDALTDLNPLTGTRGPQLAPDAFSVDTAQALESLDRLPETPLLAFGHGDPWTEGTAAAVSRAREVASG
jgi:glyoxylase-like metal-dependent hydrolase (beta-lactamase superfamily II)